mmetsp:Transcript_26803/g.79998  ORF Transcript_26803/g.79998 Transcript_26803/m.79998 type:complete len:214 (+) Transcript_26803:177-818(+)
MSIGLPPSPPPPVKSMSSTAVAEGSPFASEPLAALLHVDVAAVRRPSPRSVASSSKAPTVATSAPFCQTSVVGKTVTPRWSQSASCGPPPSRTIWAHASAGPPYSSEASKSATTLSRRELDSAPASVYESTNTPDGAPHSRSSAALVESALAPAWCRRIFMETSPPRLDLQTCTPGRSASAPATASRSVTHMQRIDRLQGWRGTPAPLAAEST